MRCTLLTLRCCLWGSGSLLGLLHLPPKPLGKQRAPSPGGLQSSRALDNSVPRVTGALSEPVPRLASGDGPAHVWSGGSGSECSPSDHGSLLYSLLWQNLGWTLMEDGSIRIEEATEEALGTYTCVPYNTLGTMGQSAPARLVLKVRSRAMSSLCVAGALNACLHSLAVFSLGPPVFHGATRLGVQAGGRPGATYPLCCRRGPLPCHHVEKGTSGFWSSREAWWRGRTR